MKFSKLIWCWWMRGILSAALLNCALMPVWAEPGVPDSIAQGKQTRTATRRRQKWESNGCIFSMQEEELVEIWRSSSPYTASVYIDRYFGSKNEIQTQIEKGLMDAWAQVEITTYDCDRNTFTKFCEPEYDEVYLNGSFLGLVDGHNQCSYTTVFYVHVEDLNLPSSPGDIAENTIEIHVDTKNSMDEWVLYPQEIKIRIQAPLPVYMVKGWTNDMDNIQELKDTVNDEYGLPVFLAPVEQDNACQTNASLMYNDLESRIKECRVPQFNILAHSKGGLDSRFLVDAKGCDCIWAHNVLQIATPNCGSRLADYIIYPRTWAWRGPIKAIVGCMRDTPGSRALTTGECLIYNYDYFSPRAPVHVVIGDTSNKVWFYMRWIGRSNYGHNFKSPDINRHGDIMVSIPSAHGTLKVDPRYDEENRSPAPNVYLSTQGTLVDDGSTYTEHSNIITFGAKRMLEYYQHFLAEQLQDIYAETHLVFPNNQPEEKSRRSVKGAQEQQIGAALAAAGLIREEEPKASSEAVIAMAPRGGMDDALVNGKVPEITEEELKYIMDNLNLSRSEALAFAKVVQYMAENSDEDLDEEDDDYDQNSNKELVEVTVAKGVDGVGKFKVTYPGVLVINIQELPTECTMTVTGPDGNSFTVDSFGGLSKPDAPLNVLYCSRKVSLCGEYQLRIAVKGELEQPQKVECYVATAVPPDAPKLELRFAKSTAAAEDEIAYDAWIESDGQVVKREKEKFTMMWRQKSMEQVYEYQEVTMHDDGLDGDEVAGDGRYFARVKVEKNRGYQGEIHALGTYKGNSNNYSRIFHVFVSGKATCWVDDVSPINGKIYDWSASRSMGLSAEIIARIDAEGLFALDMVLEDENKREVRVNSGVVQWQAGETKNLQLTASKHQLNQSKAEGKLRIKRFELKQKVDGYWYNGSVVRRSVENGETVVDPGLVLWSWHLKGDWPQSLRVVNEELEYKEAFPHFKAMYLRVDFHVQVPPKHSGMYYLTGVLFDLDGRKVADSVYAPVEIQGKEENGQLLNTLVSMRFSGGILHRWRINGPLVLKHVAFAQCDDPRFNRREVRGFSHRTQSYNWEQFQNSNQWCYEAMLVEPIRATTPDENGRFDLTLKAVPASGGGVLTGPFGIELRDYYMGEYPGRVVLAETNCVDLYGDEGYLLTDQIMEAAKSVGNCDGWLDIGESVEVTIPCIASGLARENPLDYLPFMTIWGEYASEKPYLERDQVTYSPRHYFDVDEDGVITDDEVEYGVDCWNDGKVVHRTAITGLAAYLEAEGRYRYDNKSGDFLPDI